MSRRTRRMRRRLHRRDVRGEPLTLLVDDRYPGETLETLLRAIYRSELARSCLGQPSGWHPSLDGAGDRSHAERLLSTNTHPDTIAPAPIGRRPPGTT